MKEKRVVTTPLNGAFETNMNNLVKHRCQDPAES